MKRILLSIFYILFIVNSYAQYTTIINSNKPGKTQTAYAIGTDVIQFENTFSYKSLQLNKFEYSESTNNLNIRYGFFKEKLEAILNGNYTSGDQTITNTNKNGISRLSIGLKYLVFDFNKEDTPEKYRSWKKRYGFWQNAILPAIAIAAHYNSPFSNKNFINSGQSSFSLSLIIQNNINQKLRINNQFDYNYIGADVPEFEYNISSSYAFSKRLIPYIQLGYHNSDLYSSINLGFGTPYIINKNLTVSAFLDSSFGTDVTGYELGINASYRLDYHEDKWVYKESKLALEKKLEDERDIDKQLLEEEMGLSVASPEKKGFFSKITSIFKKKKDIKKKDLRIKKKRKKQRTKKEKKITKKKSGFFKKLFKKKKKEDDDNDDNEKLQDIISDF